MTDLAELRVLKARVDGETGDLLVLHDDICRVLGATTGAPLSNAVTASIDAALALVERCLPGWSWEIAWCSDLKRASVRLVKGPMRENTAGCPGAMARTEPLAILSALLAALIAEEEAKQRELS